MQRFIPRLIGFAALAAVFPCASAFAGTILTPTGQLRETEVLAEITGEGAAADADLDSAPGFGSFSSVLDAHVELGNVLDPVTADSDGDQSSDILTSAIKASGSAAAVCSDEDLGLLPSSFGRSFFSVTFELSDPTEYVLTGGLEAASVNGGSPLANVQLESTLDGTVYVLSITDGLAPILSAGLLPAGEYTLSALAEAIADPSNKSAYASFDIEFKLVPEPGMAALLALGALLARRSR